MNTPQNSAPGNNDMGRKILLVALSCVGLAAVMMLGLFVTKFWILPQAIEQNKTAQAQQAAAPGHSGRRSNGRGWRPEARSAPSWSSSSRPSIRRL